MHIPDRDRCNWLRERIETPEQVPQQPFLRPCVSPPFDPVHASPYARFSNLSLHGVQPPVGRWAQFKYSAEKKIHILDRLAWSEMFESFLANKFAAAKRFGLEARFLIAPASALPFFCCLAALYIGVAFFHALLNSAILDPCSKSLTVSIGPVWGIQQGCESLIPGMKALIDRGTELGVDSIVMGMPHRGGPRPAAWAPPPCFLTALHSV